MVLASILKLRGKMCGTAVLQDHKWEIAIGFTAICSLSSWIDLLLFIFIYIASFQGPKVIQITQNKYNTLPWLHTGIYILILLHHCNSYALCL